MSGWATGPADPDRPSHMMPKRIALAHGTQKERELMAGVLYIMTHCVWELYCWIPVSNATSTASNSLGAPSRHAVPQAYCDA